MILGHGIDLVEISRLKRAMERRGSHFEKRVFGETERAYCHKYKDPYPHFAARFAAKEAYGKALGLGIGPSGELAHIEVINLASGVPEIHLQKEAKKIFKKKGGKQILLSLSHDGDMAMASVIIVGKA